MNVYELEDIINALKEYRKETSEEAFEPILYFVSFLTGISVDALLQKM